MSSYASPAMTGRSRIRLAMSHVPDRPTHEREDEDRDDHDPEQKRCSATRVDQAELLHVRRRELGAALERVDRLVLGAVVLEDTAEVGEQRDDEDVADEDADPDHPLDDHEELRRLDGKPARHERGADLEEHQREADRDRRTRR